MKIGSYNLSDGAPAIMGIVNTTPDSFSDGAKYLNTSSAIRHAIGLIEDGADIIDIGGESTRPGAEEVSSHDELKRVIPVIEGIRGESDVPISIDTTKAEVARRSIDAGANMINDISAGHFDEGMFGVAASYNVPISLMHIKGTPRTMQLAPQYGDLMREIRSYLSDAIDAAIAAGVKNDSIMIDPGIGFGKTVEDNLEILKRLDELTDLKAPILIGTSRKSFIGKVLNEEVDGRLEGSLATLAASINLGARVLRVHDVAPTKKFISMYLSCI